MPLGSFEMDIPSNSRSDVENSNNAGKTVSFKKSFAAPRDSNPVFFNNYGISDVKITKVSFHIAVIGEIQKYP